MQMTTRYPGLNAPLYTFDASASQPKHKIIPSISTPRVGPKDTAYVEKVHEAHDSVGKK